MAPLNNLQDLINEDKALLRGLLFHYRCYMYSLLLLVLVITSDTAMHMMLDTADLYDPVTPRLGRLEFVLDVLIESLHRGEQEVLLIFGQEFEPGDMELYAEASQFR